MRNTNFSYINSDSIFRSKEKIPTYITSDPSESSLLVAKEIRDLILKTQAEGRSCVLGLATGSTPIAVYKELIRYHKQEGLSFKNVITFNLDEYYPLEKVKISIHFQLPFHDFLEHSCNFSLNKYRNTTKATTIS